MWKRLTAQEREEFAHMLKDGRLANLVTIWTPWWMAEVGVSVSVFSLPCKRSSAKIRICLACLCVCACVCICVCVYRGEEGGGAYSVVDDKVGGGGGAG